jgi:hypothetical protein
MPEQEYPVRSATRVVASTFAVIIGLAGLEHGAGEVLQGSVAPEAIMIESWPESEFLRILAGEPAMTLIPNLLAAGMVTVLLSLLTIGWMFVPLTRTHAGKGLMLLSVALLLAGGGLGPPLMGIIVGAAATRSEKPLTWLAARSETQRPPLLARLWLTALIASVAGYLTLLPIVPLLNHYSGEVDPMVVAYAGIFSFSTLILAVIGALTCDAHQAVSASGNGTATT